MSDSQGGPSIGGIFAGSLGIILGTICIVGYAASFLVIDYIDGQIEENCEGTIKGDFIEITQIDEGKCQDGKDTKEMILSFQMPLLLAGVLFIIIGVWANYQS